MLAVIKSCRPRGSERPACGKPAWRRRSDRPKSAETLESFKSRYEISYRRPKLRSVRLVGPRLSCDMGHARTALAEVLGVAAREILVRDRPD
jgi:hypothetical protein